MYKSEYKHVQKIVSIRFSRRENTTTTLKAYAHQIAYGRIVQFSCEKKRQIFLFVSNEKQTNKYKTGRSNVPYISLRWGLNLCVCVCLPLKCNGSIYDGVVYVLDFDFTSFSCYLTFKWIQYDQSLSSHIGSVYRYILAQIQNTCSTFASRFAIRSENGYVINFRGSAIFHLLFVQAKMIERYRTIQSFCGVFVRLPATFSQNLLSVHNRSPHTYIVPSRVICWPHIVN